MAPITRRVYTTYLMLAMLCVLATYQGASGGANDVEEFTSASPSTNRNILEASCATQGESCRLTGSTRCCGNLECETHNGEKCQGSQSSCICRNPFTTNSGF
ncbi:uncharacterized protein LOC105442646 [Strongylocentrotus purpuratus]|uniref:Uncharacterized protein n=1 Tax=Strongylocentrotus purpuratus TaxID=7668 RepID=A0A7M7LTB2_STRPU|nr:uncharacterized protein LOC105442646 [Strongylocentrotus purpuratus]XP_030851939.1 uncharacterized protein LOC105442646 [Strongylocentrotus purpuratus]|eukprot:XP_011673260.1 PREDICTED: uncharacterized protein LOC105442646 [Strongylocentrotus purpuratus]